MKYLILMLISFNSYADVKIDISRSNGGKYGASFKTQQLADDWKADNISNDSWGKPQRWETYLAQTDCLQFRDVVEMVLVDEILTPTVIGQDCERPAEYTITQTDITAEVNAKKAKKDADDLSITSIEAKLLDGSAKLEDLILMLKIMRGL